MHYIMLGGDGYMSCNSCDYKEPPASYFSKLMVDEYELMKCPQCEEPIKRLLFKIDEDWNTGDRFVECPKCKWQKILNDDDLKSIVDAHIGFKIDGVAFKITREGVGQILLGYTKEHPERFEVKPDE